MICWNGKLKPDLMNPASRLFQIGGAVAVALIMGCANAPPQTPVANAPQEMASASWQRWRHYKLPGKTNTNYEPAQIDGRDAMAVRSDASASLLRQKLRVASSDLDHIKFSWKVPALIANANLAAREFADSPVRVVLAFEGDRSKFNLKNTMLSELAHALTGEPMPYATLMYVWCNTRVAGTVITSPRTDRIRKIVVESGSAHLNQWLSYERNIRTDFELAFGEPPGALLGVAIMTDTDNTRSSAQAWYGPVKLTRKH